MRSFCFVALACWHVTLLWRSYLFSNDSKLQERVLTNTSSGSAVVNDCLMQASVAALPFGGVGESGQGTHGGGGGLFAVLSDRVTRVRLVPRSPFVQNVYA